MILRADLLHRKKKTNCWYMSADCRKVGWLHIKPEYSLFLYLYSICPDLLTFRYVLPSDPLAVDENFTSEDRHESKKRKRGQNSNRQRPNFRESTVLCPSFAQNLVCPFGD